MAIKRGIDIKLNIQPILGALIHDNVFEGPCRFGSGAQLEKEFDQFAAGEAFKAFQENMKKYFSGEDYNILEPKYFERNEEFLGISEEILADLTENDHEADCYLFASSGRIYDYMMMVAQMTGKPIVTVQWCCNNTIETAAIRARGGECYAYDSWEETADRMRLLRVRKVMRSSNVLLITRGNSNMATLSCADGFLSLDQVTRDIGPRFRYMDLHEFLDQAFTPDPNANYTLPTRKDCYNLTRAELDEVEELADELIAGAIECKMDREAVIKSLRVYRMSKKMMEVMDCSAMAAPCPEACATTRLNNVQATFCLNHSLLNEEGIPSACEYDIPGVLAMMLLNNLARGAAYLGNTTPVTLSKEGAPLSNVFNFYPDLMDVVNGVEDEQVRHNLILTAHSTPNRKMAGFDKAAAPYQISPFTGSGWGATLRRDFTLDKGQVITMARFSPDGKSIFVGKGTIVGCVGYNSSGCTTGVVYSVADRKDFFRKQCEFGNHMPLVYGDYVNDVVELGEMMGLRVVTA